MMGIYPLVIKETEKILIVAPHPDDESIGTGGLLSLYSNQCDVIVMTDGRYGNTEIYYVILKTESLFYMKSISGKLIFPDIHLFFCQIQRTITVTTWQHIYIRSMK